MTETGIAGGGPSQIPGRPAATAGPVRRSSPAEGTSGVHADRDNSGAGAATALAGAEQVADRSRTARRDALVQELRRLIAVARKLNGAGELRSNADAMQEIARAIAKVARAIADAERQLPPSQRRGIQDAALGVAPPTRSVPARNGGQEAIPDETEVSAARAHGASPASDGTATAAGNVGTVPRAPAGAGEADAPDRNAGSGTGQLLREAAGLLDRIRDTVDAAARLERLLDPEAGERRDEARREVEGFAAELRGLAAALGDASARPGVDLQA